MNVETYIEKCNLRLNRPWRDPTCTNEKREVLKKKNSEVSEEDDIFTNNSYYLQFVRETSLSSRLVLLVLLLIFVTILAYGIQPGQMGQVIQPIQVSDQIIIAIVGLLVVFWPVVHTDRKVWFAILINIFTFAYFGTFIGIIVGVLALTIMAGFWAIYFVHQYAYYRNWYRHRLIVYAVSVIASLLTISIVGAILTTVFAWSFEIEGSTGELSPNSR
jgi:hypothetical protein